MDVVLVVSTIKEEKLHVEDIDDSCQLKITDVVLLARDANDLCRLEITNICSLARNNDNVGGALFAEVKEENLEFVKQEPEDVCCIICVIFSFSR